MRSLANFGLVHDSSIEAVRAALCRAIDERAEVIRGCYLTPGTGQALVYQQKFAEATAAAADPDPSRETFPLLAASLGIDGSNISEIATVVLTAAAAWTRIAALVETSRLLAKHEIRGAATAAEALAAFDRATWLEAL
jgi:hypothetical protein